MAADYNWNEVIRGITDTADDIYRKPGSSNTSQKMNNEVYTQTKIPR